jgi:DNA-binding transcriptional regulator YiaG
MDGPVSDSAASTTPDEDKRRRKTFGAYLKALRERSSNLSQVEAATALEYKASSVARFEDGTVEPRPADIRALSLLYQEPLERIVSAYCSAYFFDEDVPSFLLSRSRRPGAPSAAGEAFFATNYTEMWSLSDVLRWEEALAEVDTGPDPKDLWVVSPEFHDHENPEIRRVVETLLKAGFAVTYFLPKRCSADFAGFVRMMGDRLSRNSRRPDLASQLTMVQLDEDEDSGDLVHALLMNSAVISFPSWIETSRPGYGAFNIVRIRDQRRPGDIGPVFGIPLAEDEIKKLHGWLYLKRIDDGGRQ